jgi:hypothetical protein
MLNLPGAVAVEHRLDGDPRLEPAMTTLRAAGSERSASGADGTALLKAAQISGVMSVARRAAGVVPICHRPDRENLNHFDGFTAAVPTFRDAVHWIKASDTKV